MTATSIRLRRHAGYRNSENSEARNAVNFKESVPNDQEEPKQADLEVDESEEVESQEEQESEVEETEEPVPADEDEAEALRIQEEADAADAALEKPTRNQSKETWTTYVEALHTKPEGYSENLSRDQIADLVLGPKG